MEDCCKRSVVMWYYLEFLHCGMLDCESEQESGDEEAKMV